MTKQDIDSTHRDVGMHRRRSSSPELPANVSSQFSPTSSFPLKETTLSSIELDLDHRSLHPTQPYVTTKHRLTNPTIRLQDC
jgi:hypothetical protein